MNRGDKALILLAATALAGCTAGKGELSIRAIADPAAKFRQGSADVAAARGQLMLGNVGLALEAFRIIQRNRPTDPAAPAGIAECYAAMGRFDLAQSNFEAALALAPHDPALLLGLAGIYDSQGDHARAVVVRAEAAAQKAAAAPATAAVQTPARSVRAQEPLVPKFAHVGSITVELPKARPADRLADVSSKASAQLAQAAETGPIAWTRPAAVTQTQLPQALPAAVMRSTITVALPPARPADRLTTDANSARLQLADAATTIPLEAAAENAFAPAAPPVHATIPQPVQPAPHAPQRASMTVALPPARPAGRLGAESSAPRSELAQASATPPLALAIPYAPPAEPRPAPLKGANMPVTFAEAEGPRIERISPGEVMLVTSGRPLWRQQIASRAMASTKVQWIPLGNAAVKPNIQVLNAARREGIARSARAVLADRGWRRISVGDAALVREKSVVLYPRNRAGLGRSLAAQFGVAAQASDVELPLLILGRDAAELVRSQRKS